MILNTHEQFAKIRNGGIIEVTTVYVTYPYGTPRYFAYLSNQGAGRVYLTKGEDGVWKKPY